MLYLNAIHNILLLVYRIGFEAEVGTRQRNVRDSKRDTERFQYSEDAVTEAYWSDDRLVNKSGRDTVKLCA